MNVLIAAYSKYFITLFLWLFLGCAFVSLRYVSVRKQRRVALVQSLFLFLSQLAVGWTIGIRTGRLSYLILYAFVSVLTLAVLVFTVLIYPGANLVLLNAMCMLVHAGMIVLTRINPDRAVRQLVIAAISFFLAMFVPFVMGKFPMLRRYGGIYAACGIGALALVLVLGRLTNGSRLSFTISSITFQPSELVKITYVFFLASLLGAEPGFFKILSAGALAALHVLILVFSKDLGSALIYYVVAVMMITIASHRLRYALAGAVLGGFASVAAYALFPHVQVRVQAFLDPWSVVDSQGYQITQSLFALSRGGWFGLGIGKGTPGDIPFVETDFIFSALTEEMGLLFGIGIVLTGVVIFLILMRLACGIRDGFYKNLTVGFGVSVVVQLFLTVGGGTKFIPLTGVTLPLVSYGGSSVLATVLMLYVVQGIYQLRYNEERKLEQKRKKEEKQQA